MYNQKPKIVWYIILDCDGQELHEYHQNKQPLPQKDHDIRIPVPGTGTKI